VCTLIYATGALQGVSPGTSPSLSNHPLGVALLRYNYKHTNGHMLEWLSMLIGTHALRQHTLVGKSSMKLRRSNRLQEHRGPMQGSHLTLCSVSTSNVSSSDGCQHTCATISLTVKSLMRSFPRCMAGCVVSLTMTWGWGVLTSGHSRKAQTASAGECSHGHAVSQGCNGAGQHVPITCS